LRLNKPNDMNPKRILFVEGDERFLKALARTFVAEGYEVLLAEDGAGAVSTARQEQPDLILLSIYFPPDVAHGGGVSWDGFLILSWIRKMEELKATRVVIVGDEDSAELREQARSAGASGYFPKTCGPDQLLSMVRQLLPQAVANQAAA